MFVLSALKFIRSISRLTIVPHLSKWVSPVDKRRMKIDLSDSSWVGALVIIVSAMASLGGLSAIFWSEPATVVAFVAGGGWLLALALFVMNGRERQISAAHKHRISNLEIDLKEMQRMASEWSASSKEISEAVRTVVMLQHGNLEQPKARIKPKRDTQAEEE